MNEEGCIIHKKVDMLFWIYKNIDYWHTVESQGRGSLHLHLLIWLNHDFTPTQLKQQIQNEDFRQKLLKYLEDIVKEDLDQFRGNSYSFILIYNLKYSYLYHARYFISKKCFS